MGFTEMALLKNFTSKENIKMGALDQEVLLI